MRYLTTTSPPEDFLGGYGQDWRQGVLSEQLELYLAAGGVVRPAASGSGASWAVVDGVAYPVVCSEVVEVWTEDGRQSGRCGRPAVELGSCEGHAAQQYAWRQEDRERLGWSPSERPTLA